LTLSNPDVSRIKRLLTAHHIPSVAVRSCDPSGMGIVVNCTPVGMRRDDPLPIDIDRVEPGTIVVDVILKPEVSPMLERARSRGLATQTGRAMLEGQVDAVLGFFGWKA
jgi:shikimate dehydrogenase